MKRKFPIRNVARGWGFDYYKTGKPCIHGHNSVRYVGNGNCVACSKITSSKWHRDNREHRLAKAKQWREENREYMSQYHKEYLQENLDRHAKYQAKRRALKLQANYGNEELNDLVFSEAYELAKLREKTTSVKHHVDHIIPLKGKNVCGFHSWNNIRVVPATENLSKGNKIVENLF